MESFIKSDIFFVVTTVVVLVLGVLGAIFLIYAIRTARIVKDGVTTIKQTVESSSEYIEEVKKNFIKQGALFTLVKKFIGKKK